MQTVRVRSSKAVALPIAAIVPPTACDRKVAGAIAGLPVKSCSAARFLSISYPATETDQEPRPQAS